MNKDNEQLEILRRIEESNAAERKSRKDWVVSKIKEEQEISAFFTGIFCFIILFLPSLFISTLTLITFSIEDEGLTFFIASIISLIASYSISNWIYLKFLKKEVNLNDEEVTKYILNHSNRQYYSNRYNRYNR